LPPARDAGLDRAVSPADTAAIEAVMMADAARDAEADAHAPDSTPPDAGTQGSSALQRFVDWRFGMFLHFGMNTFSNDNGDDLPNQDPAKFNPTALDPGQWMDAAKSAGMTFAILTTKHHDGFLLWDSATTSYDTGNPAVPPAGRKDVVKLFVEAARARGIAPGLYFSVQDRSASGLHGTDAAPFDASWGAQGARMPRPQIDLVKAQIRELLSRYGTIPFFVTDGWAWSMGHTVMPYGEIRALVREVSPETIFSDISGVNHLWHEDAIFYEEPKGGAWAPAGNTAPAWQSQKSGRRWYWTPGDATTVGLSVDSIVITHLADLQPKYCNFVPNFGPNRRGLLEPAQVALLKQVGQRWQPDRARPPQPAQPPRMRQVLTAVAATATSSAAGSNPRAAIDGINDGGWPDRLTQTLWVSAGPAPQALTVDLGAVHDGIDMVTYLPPQLPPRAPADPAGRITGYRLAASEDGTTFTPLVLRAGSDGKWASDVSLKAALFQPVRARYLRLEITASAGGVAKVSELDVGVSGP
jgi:alpha-L-fucosidase